MGLDGKIKVRVLLLSVPLLGGCHGQSCDRQRMISMVNAHIARAGRSPGDYKIDPSRVEGRIVYLGAAAKKSPLYYRHYFIDPSSCRIIDVYVDQ